jgi:hypothetical protein
VAELRVPFSSLRVEPHESVAFFVTLSEGTVEIEQQPRREPIHVEVPDGSFASRNWTV